MRCTNFEFCTPRLWSHPHNLWQLDLTFTCIHTDICFCIYNIYKYIYYIYIYTDKSVCVQVCVCVCVCNSLRLLAKTFKQSLIVLAGWSGLGLKPSPAFLDCCLRPGTSPCYPVTSGTSTSNALRDQARRPRKPLSLQAWRIYKERRKCMEAFKPRQRFHGKSHWRVWRHHLKRHVRQSSTISNSRHPLVVSCRKCKGWRLEMSAYVLRHLLAAIDKSLLGIFHQHLFSWPLVASIAETGAKWIQEEHGMIKEWRWVPQHSAVPIPA